MDVELAGDLNLHCDFADGFDEKMCTGGIQSFENPATGVLLVYDFELYF